MISASLNARTPLPRPLTLQCSARQSSGRGGPPGGRGGSGQSGQGGRGGDFRSGQYSGRGGGRGGSGGSAQILQLDQARMAIQRLFENVAVKVAPKQVGGLLARPNAGTVGEKVKLLVNHFQMGKLPADSTIYQYAVEVVKQRRNPGISGGGKSGPPPVVDRDTSRRVLSKVAEEQGWQQGAWAYDSQKMLYTSLPQLISAAGEDITVKLLIEGAPTTSPSGAASPPPSYATYQVTLRPTATSHELSIGNDLATFFGNKSDDSEALRPGIQALDVVFRQSASLVQGNKLLGRGVYTQEGKTRFRLGLEAWRGYTQSIALTQKGPMLTVDTSVAAVGVREPLIAWIADVLGQSPDAIKKGRGLTPSDISALNNALKRKSLSVVVTHRDGTKRKIRGFTNESARDSKFSLKDGTTMTVEKYFKQSHGLTLAYPSLPCADVGNSKRPDWLPAEVCVVVPDSGPGALGPSDTAQMVRMAAVRPEDRIQDILRTLKTRVLPQIAAFSQAFGLQFRQEMMQVDGRVLPQPRLAYGAGKHLDPGQKGDWSLRGVQFRKTATISSCAVVSYVSQGKAGGAIMDAFLKELKSSHETLGIQISPSTWPPPVVYKSPRDDDATVLRNAVNAAKAKSGKPADMVFVILEEENRGYGEVKTICDCTLGVQSQVLVYKNLKLYDPGPKLGRSLGGVALKVNTKLGGDNTAISGTPADWLPAAVAPGQTQPPRIMVLGADVTHSGVAPGQGKQDVPSASGAAASDGGGATAAPPESQAGSGMPSVSAVVGTTNLECSTYVARIYAQTARQEFIADMQEAVHDLLKQYQKNNKDLLPEVIIMFRDGISEGQFRPVLKSELGAMKEAFKQFSVAGKSYNPRVTFVTVQKRHQTRFFPGSPNSNDTFLGLRSGNVRPGVVVDQGICHPREFDFYLNSHAGIQGTNRCPNYTVLHDEVGFGADSMQLFAYWLCYTLCRCTRSVSIPTPAFYADLAAWRGRHWLEKGKGGQWSLQPIHPNVKDTMFWV